MSVKNWGSLALLVALANVGGGAVYAQEIDPSIIRPEIAPPIQAPREAPEFFLDGGPLLGVEPGGGTFELQQVTLTGNTIFDDETLQALVADRIGEQTDFSDLQALANTISAYYRENGYPFARAYLPAQDIQNGEVAFEILEGRYGDVAAVNAPSATPAMDLQARRNRAVADVLETLREHFDGDELGEVVGSIDALFDQQMESLEDDYAEFDQALTPNPQAQRYTQRLQPDEVIESDEIERVALILDDIPGYTAVPVVRPGQRRGTGDLEVRMIESDTWVRSAALDNHGSTSSGRNRARVDLARARNFVFGDQLSLTGLLTDEETWLLSTNYSLPVGASGLRLNGNLLVSNYELGAGEFAGIADGGTNQAGLSLSYPLLRSQSRNLTANVAGNVIEHTNNRLDEKETYNTLTVPVSVNFDWRDGLGAGGLTYGALRVQYNQISDDQRISGPDDNYGLVAFDIARAQRLADRWQALVRLSTQYTDANIDSSNFLSLGGFNAVRAYPVGEFSGRRGAVMQAEVSHNMPRYSATPYAFFDIGRAERITTDDLTESRTLSGYGVGLRYSNFGLSFDLSAAWNASGGESAAEPGEDWPWVWFSLTREF